MLKLILVDLAQTALHEKPAFGVECISMGITITVLRVPVSGRIDGTGIRYYDTGVSHIVCSLDYLIDPSGCVEEFLLTVLPHVVACPESRKTERFIVCAGFSVNDD